MPTVVANGLRIHFEQTGPEAGPPVVFVNALGATTLMWREQVAVLSRRYRCVTYDANGHGATPARPITSTRPALSTTPRPKSAMSLSMPRVKYAFAATTFHLLMHPGAGVGPV